MHGMLPAIGSFTPLLPGKRGSELRQNMKLSIVACYALAWKSFSKWWISLCLISGGIFVFQIIPQVVVRPEVNELNATAQQLAGALLQNDMNALEEIVPRLAGQTGMLMRKTLRFGVYVFPLVALLTVALLMYANRAVKNRKEPNTPLLTLSYIALVHVVLAVGKLLAFFFFVLPGVYLYIKLLFVSLVMLEEKKSARAAIQQSWRLTRGNFWELLLLVLMNTGVQLLVLPTVIGEIPATGFVNTARAAAYRMIREEDHPAEA
jgi:hypothetical protein